MDRLWQDFVHILLSIKQQMQDVTVAGTDDERTLQDKLAKIKERLKAAETTVAEAYILNDPEIIAKACLVQYMILQHICLLEKILRERNIPLSRKEPGSCECLLS